MEEVQRGTISPEVLEKMAKPLVITEVGGSDGSRVLALIAGITIQIPRAWVTILPPPPPPEPGPGAYLMDGLLLVRFPGDNSDPRWALQSDEYQDGHTWVSWADITQANPRATIKQLWEVGQ